MNNKNYLKTYITLKYNKQYMIYGAWNHNSQIINLFYCYIDNVLVQTDTNA